MLGVRKEMKLTKRDKQILLDAAQLIATGKVRCSCDAVAFAEVGHCGDTQLKIEYGCFYEKEPYMFWGLSTERKDSRRILMLLLFREVGLENVI